MWTNALRDHIEATLARPDSRDAIAARVEEICAQEGQQATTEVVSGVIDQLERYVTGTPELLSAAAFEASDFDILQTIEPLLVRCADYFLEESDLIPDKLGVYGLLDDAYLAQTFLWGISVTHEQQTGIPLLGTYLAGANAKVRAFIGNTIATQLDEVVIHDLEAAAVQARIAELARHPRTMGSGASGERGSWGSAWEDEMARSAAKLGVSLELD